MNRPNPPRRPPTLSRPASLPSCRSTATAPLSPLHHRRNELHHLRPPDLPPRRHMPVQPHIHQCDSSHEREGGAREARLRNALLIKGASTLPLPYNAYLEINLPPSLDPVHYDFSDRLHNSPPRNLKIHSHRLGGAAP